MGRKPRNKIALDKAAAEYRTGLFTSMKDAANYYGVSKKTLGKKLGDYRHRKRRSDKDLQDYPRKLPVRTPAELSYSLPGRLPHQSDRLFGDLYIENPASSLNQEDMRRLSEIMVYLNERELRIEQDDGPAPLFNWIKSPEYLKLKIDERAAWHKAYGQERELNLFVAPSGSLNARLIIHLHCPSFACAENRSEECFDLSSRCLAQLQLLGFNTGNSLFVDHNPRREAHNLGTLLPITEYPPPVREVHERFMNNVRERSAAVVELCFGKAVEQRMRDLLGQRIQPLKLWGTYEGITLWLEFDRVLDGTCDTKLLRIILFVEHPSSTFWCSSQRFNLYHSTTFTTARLAGIELRTTQNLGILRCPPRHRLTPAQARESYELNRMATEDLKRLGLIKHARVAAAHEPEGCQQDHVKDLELAEVTENGILNAGEAAEAVEHAAKWATTQAHVVSESPSPGIEPRTMPGNPSARVMKSTSEKRGFGTGQRTQHPAWYVNFVRSQEECREFRIPFTILTTCVKCRKALQQGPTMMDLDARWTINTPPTYIPRQRTCGASGHEKATFVPVNIDIPIVSDSGLTTFWRKNIATGKIPLDDARRHFDQIFGPRKLWYLPWHIIKTRFATED